MADVAFAQEMVLKSQALLRKFGGARQIQNDGAMITLGDAKKDLKYWEQELAAAKRLEVTGVENERPTIAGIDLS